MSADATRRLLSIDLLDAAEHTQLDGWGNRAVLARPAPVPVSIPVLFAAQVARTPEAVALSCGQRSWTYRELEEAANRLAHLLAGQPHKHLRPGGLQHGVDGGVAAACQLVDGPGDLGGQPERFGASPPGS